MGRRDRLQSRCTSRLRVRDTRDGRLRKHNISRLDCLRILVLVLVVHIPHRGVSDPDRSCLQDPGRSCPQDPDRVSDQVRSCSPLQDRCQDRDRSCLQDPGSSCRLALVRSSHPNGQAVPAHSVVHDLPGLINNNHNSNRSGMEGRPLSQVKVIILVVVLVVRRIRLMRPYRLARLRILRSRAE